MNAQELLSVNIGTNVETAAGVMVIESLLSDKMGVMKNGEKAPYVRLVGDNGEIALHPEKAKQLIIKGECGALRILKDVVTEAEVAVAAEIAVEPAEIAVEPIVSATEAEVAVAAEIAVEPAEIAVEPIVETAPTSDEVTKVANGPTKKSETIRICNEMWADGKVRKDIMVVLMNQLGLSKQGANTYYQNVKSGMWK